MKNTTLVYILKDGCALMLHRVKKENDINHGKWIGVGGKFEWGETPEECMRREVMEETGLFIDKYRYCGIVTFISDEEDMEYMHLFTVTAFHDRYGNRVTDEKKHTRYKETASSDMHADVKTGEADLRDDTHGDYGTGPSDVILRKCDEGELEWLPQDQLTHIPHWAGDRLFLSMILGTEFPFFSMKFVYHHGTLAHASVNEHNCLITDRLILRPWFQEDAAALYKAASDPKIGPAAGWLPHKDISHSRKVIRETLTRPEMYAIVLRDTSDPIGSVGLQNFRMTDADGTLISYFDERKSPDPLCCTRPGDDVCPETSLSSGEDRHSVNRHKAVNMKGSPANVQFEASLGYWLAEPYWHRGLMTEAVTAVLEHGRRDLGLKRVWADYFEGNDASRRVMERAGFKYHHTETKRVQQLGGEERTSVYNVLEPR